MIFCSPSLYRACIVLAAIAAAAFLLVSNFARAEGLVWHPESVTAQGSGCRFTDAPGRPADAFVVTAGDEISIVYSALGSEFLNRRNGVQASNCNLVLPVDLSPGFYVSAVEQKFLYGISKQAGVGVLISAVSNFARIKPNGQSEANDLVKTTARAELQFPVAEEVVIALGEANMAPVRVRDDGDGNGVYRRLCAKNRLKRLAFHSAIKIAAWRDNPNAEVTVAVDGQDLKFSMANRVAPCPTRR